MLERLAGPFALHDANGDPVYISGAGSDSRALYDDLIGIASNSSDVGGYSITQMDGMTHGRAVFYNWPFVLDLTSPQNWLVHDNGVPNDTMYAFNRRAGSLGDAITAGSTATFTSCTARCADRYLKVSNGYVYWMPLDLSAGWAAEYAYGFAGGGIGACSASRTLIPGVICLGFGGGKIVFYDYVHKTQYGGESIVPANKGAWYSPKHDVFVVLTEASLVQSVSVYARTVLPVNITAPIAMTPIKTGRTSPIGVKVTGADSDLCVGELVRWSMTGSGQLLDLQTTTDGTGWAYADYLAPLVAGTDPTFTATVVF